MLPSAELPDAATLPPNPKIPTDPFVLQAVVSDLLDDEDHPELIDLCNKILKQLEETTAHYKKIAKKKGMKYEI